MGRDYYLLTGAFFISSMGEWLYRLGLPLLIFGMTGSAVGMAIAFALTFLPFLIVSPFGGVFADALDRRRLCILSDGLAALAVTGVALLAYTDGPLWLIYVLTFVASCMAPLHFPAFQSLIPQVVSDDALPRANSLVSGSETFFTIIGPLVGGGLAALIGAEGLIVINALSFGLSALMTLLVRTEKATVRKPMTVARIVADFKEGFAFAWSHPVVKYGAIMFIGTNFAINLFLGNLVFYLVGILRTSEQTLGLVMAISGLGGFAGAMIAPSLVRRFPAGRLIVSATIAAGITSFGLLLTSDPILIGVVWGLVIGLGWINAVTYFTLRQRVVPSAYLGRVIAITRLIAYTSIPVGGLLGGYLMQTRGPMIVILLCASIRLLVGLAAAFTPLASARNDHEALAPAKA